MERNNYNIPLQNCVSTLNGPVCKPCLNEFLGNQIYEHKPAPQDKRQDFCDERHTYTDCQGNVKFTLPLSSYKDIRRFAT
jgi:hypothetical protein